MLQTSLNEKKQNKKGDNPYQTKQKIKEEFIFFKWRKKN